MQHSERTSYEMRAPVLTSTAMVHRRQAGSMKAVSYCSLRVCSQSKSQFFGFSRISMCIWSIVQGQAVIRSAAKQSHLTRGTFMRLAIECCAALRMIRGTVVLATTIGWLSAAPEDSSRLVHYTQRDSAGISITVLNKSASPITAMLVSVRRFDITGKLKADIYRYVDVFVNRRVDIPINPGESRSIFLTQTAADISHDVNRYEVQFQAALFGDGVSIGTDYGVAVLLGRRATVVQGIEVVKGVLKRALSEAWSSERVLQTVSSVTAGNSPPRSILDRSAHAISLLDSFVATWLGEALKSEQAGACDACARTSLDQVSRDLEEWSLMFKEALQVAKQ